MSVVVRACTGAVLFCVLSGCAQTLDAKLSAAMSPRDAVDSVRTADFSARFPTFEDTQSGTSSAPKPMLFPGSDTEPADTSPGDGVETRQASIQPGAIIKGEGVEMNFDGADIQTVAKTLLGDILKLNVVIDPRVQGNVTLASVGAIPRKDVLPAFESILRMSNAAIVRDGKLVKIVPVPDANA